MKQETVNKRIDKAIQKFIPNESDKVKAYCKDLILSTYDGLLDEHEERNNGKPYTDSENLAFAISITLDDADTPSILKNARESR